MILVNDTTETEIINVDEDNSDPEYGITLSVNFDGLAEIDLAKIEEKDFHGHEVMFGVLRAAISNRQGFEEQEPFWKKRFMNEIFQHLEV